MTETQVQELETDVLGGEEVPREFEVEHLKAQIEGAKKQAYGVKCNFRLYKHIRDDAKMQACKTDLDQIRGIIDGAEKRLKELG